MSARRLNRVPSQEDLGRPGPAPDPVPVQQGRDLVPPAWSGPVAFFATATVALVFVPALRIIIALFAVIVAIETTVRLRRPNWYRPTTLIEPISRHAQRIFDSLGAGLAKALDLIWLSQQFWRFLRWLLPVQAIWQAVRELLVLLTGIVTAPVHILIGWARQVSRASSPALVAVMTLVVASAVFYAGFRVYDTCSARECSLDMAWQAILRCLGQWA